MKKVLIMLFFIVYSSISFAPNAPVIINIPKAVEINTASIYEPLIEAISVIESSRNDSAYNKLENAVGRLQIRQCRIEHFNNLTGKNYTLSDMYDFKKAREVFLYFAEGKSFEQAAKNWNGSGPLTIKYWEKVSAILQKV